MHPCIHRNRGNRADWVTGLVNPPLIVQKFYENTLYAALLIHGLLGYELMDMYGKNALAASCYNSLITQSHMYTSFPTQ